MPYTSRHASVPPTRESIDQLPGAAVLEFGTPWCGHCQRAQPLIEQALEDQPDVAHIKVEDGPGQRLGRGFGVKLWPTLVFLRDGKEMARLVRPQSAQAIHEAISGLTAIR